MCVLYVCVCMYVRAAVCVACSYHCRIKTPKVQGHCPYFLKISFLQMKKISKWLNNVYTCMHTYTHTCIHTMYGNIWLIWQIIKANYLSVSYSIHPPPTHNLLLEYNLINGYNINPITFSYFITVVFIRATLWKNKQCVNMHVKTND